jgi:hypothetical protein
MTPHVPENVASTLLVEWSLVTLVGNTMPPRDPNDDDEDDDEDEDDHENEPDKPPVVPEPDQE